MDVLGSRWTKIALLVALGLFAAPVTAEDRLAEALLQGWSEALESAAPISARFTIYRYETTFHQFGKGAGVFRRDELGRVSVTEGHKPVDPPSALLPANRPFRIQGFEGLWTGMETPTFTFADEGDGWYFTDVDRDGHKWRVKCLDLPSALKPENSRARRTPGLVRLGSPETTATGAICMPLFLPEVEAVRFLEPQSQRSDASVRVVSCRVLFQDGPRTNPQYERAMVTIFRPDSPLPFAISLEGYGSLYRWVFHDLEYDSQ